jgi:hypothetical protein
MASHGKWAPAATIHGFLQSELGRLIGNHLRERRPGCEVLANPGVIPHLLSAHNVRVPDFGGDLLTPAAWAGDGARSRATRRDSLAEQSGEDVVQHLDVHQHPKRAGNSGAPRRPDRRMARGRSKPTRQARAS